MSSPMRLGKALTCSSPGDLDHHTRHTPLGTVSGSLMWGPQTEFEVAFAVVFLLLSIVILALLWSKESSEFYAARSREPRT